MITILHAYGVKANREQDKEAYAVHVEEDDLPRAVTLLRAEGFPRRQRQSLAQLFQASGLVPTPFEERVRYIYGLSEELAHTISLFEGVIDTRVHVVLPSPAEDSKQTHGKASVYVKYDQDIDFASLIPQIKKLVSDSVEGIIYKDVELLAAPAYVQRATPAPPRFVDLPAGISVRQNDFNRFLVFAGALAALFFQMTLLCIWLLILYRRARNAHA